MTIVRNCWFRLNLCVMQTKLHLSEACHHDKTHPTSPALPLDSIPISTEWWNIHSAKTRQIVLKRGSGMQRGDATTFYISLIPSPKRAEEPPASRSDLVEETFLKTSDWQKHGCWELWNIKLAKTQMFKTWRNVQNTLKETGLENIKLAQVEQ